MLASQAGQVVDMPSREQEKLDESHDSLTLTYQGTRERDQAMRVFPDPMPSTHELAYEWSADKMKLNIRPRKKVAATAPKGKAKPSVADVGVGDVHSDARAAVVTELDSKLKTDADIDTFAAEKGVTLKKGQSRAQKLAALAEKIAPEK
jgi:hypothetical protein